MNETQYQPIIDWWKKLTAENNKSACAKLRRCKTLEEIFLNADYIRLKQKLSEHINGLEVIAGLLASIKNDSTFSQEKVAAKMAEFVPNTDRPIVSEIRFRRLLECETREELYPLLYRVLKMLDNKSSNINLNDLIESINFWGEKRIRRWAESYYGKLPS